MVIDDEGKASHAVTDEIFEKIISNAKDGKGKVDVKNTEDVGSLVVELNAKQMKEALEANVKIIEVNTDATSVELPVSFFENSEDGMPSFY